MYARRGGQAAGELLAAVAARHVRLPAVAERPGPPAARLSRPRGAWGASSLTCCVVLLVGGFGVWSPLKWDPLYQQVGGGSAFTCVFSDVPSGRVHLDV